MLERLKKPYPFTARISESYKTILFISWFIFIFVYLFRTDDFPNSHSISYRLLYSSLYGLVIIVVATLNIFIFSAIISPSKEKNWKVRNEMVLYLVQFLTISVAIHFLSYSITSGELSFTGIFQSIITTTLIGLIPVSIHVLNQQRKLFKKYFELAGDLARENIRREEVEYHDTIILNSQARKVNDILFIESDKNYLNIYFVENSRLNIRFTIKEMENQLAKFPYLVRCHRAYIVNSNKIQKVEGNAQGLKLFFNDFSGFVPVSRSYIAKVDHVIRPND